jgi:AcrR family transcriptional regulator
MSSRLAASKASVSAKPLAPDDDDAGRPRRRRLPAAARRASVLDAAIPVFATRGYEQTRMSDVAARVGVSEPVIFQNFGTKAELFAAALDRVSEQAAAHLSEPAGEHQPVHEWLRHLLAAEHLDHLHTAPMFGVLFEDAHRLQFEPEVTAALHRSTTRVAEAMSRILQRGQGEGSIRNDVSPLSLAWLVVSLIQARQFRRRFTPEPSAMLEEALLGDILQTLRGKHISRSRKR